MRPIALGVRNYIRAAALSNGGYVMTSSFSPLSLFAASEQGVWYDPSDFSSMFQDAAGTTPVTAVEQPVGLLLDKSKGMVLGSELVTNGTFDSNLSNWTEGAGGLWEWGDGKALLTGSPDATSTLFQTVIPLGWSVITFDLVLTSGSLKATFVNCSPSEVTWTTSGTKVTYVYNGTGVVRVLSFLRATAPITASIDNISVKELAGNHATQSTTTKRPVISARYNLLTKTEDFSDAAWIKSSASISANAINSPIGSLTADTITTSSTSGNVYQQSSVAVGISYTRRIRIKQNGTRWALIITYDGANGVRLWVDLQSKVKGSVALMGVGATHINSTVTAIEDGWVLVEVVFTLPNAICYHQINCADADLSFSSPIGSTLYLWGAEHIPTSQASLPYQRVNTATDYDTVGFKPYLKFDGTDDALVTSAIDFSAVDSMSVFAGLRKLSDAAQDIVVELTATTASNNGSFSIQAPDSAAANTYLYESKGTALTNTQATGQVAPLTSVLTGLSDISTDYNVLRVNGVQADSDTGDQGTGNYANAAMYIGARAGTSLYAGIHLYSLIIRGAASTATQITNTESWVNARTGAF